MAKLAVEAIVIQETATGKEKVYEPNSDVETVVIDNGDGTFTTIDGTVTGKIVGDAAVVKDTVTGNETVTEPETVVSGF